MLKKLWLTLKQVFFFTYPNHTIEHPIPRVLIKYPLASIFLTARSLT